MSKFILMVGLPASGKSTIAKEISIKEEAIVHSSDKLREELFADSNNNDNNDLLFQALHKRIKHDLLLGKNVIYDATNINYKRRMTFLQEIKKYNCYTKCIFIATPYDQCLIQNSQRDRNVPEHVIKRMYKNFYIPQLYEGWNEIEIIWNFDKDGFDVHELFNGDNGLNKIEQDNPNHTYTIGKHCLVCANICEQLIDDFELNLSALYHDIGKKFTKEFKNSKGEVTTEAHYYQHHLVSAYNAMFYLKKFGLEDDIVLKVCNYIQWHMQPFFINSDKSKQKFINLVGQDFYDKLMLLHEADVKAK